VTELHFWLEFWEHECCGDGRTVGDEITASLTFVRAVQPSEDYDSVLALDDGEMLIAGEVAVEKGGWLVRSGAMSFGLDRPAVAPGVRCQRRLWEIRHET
jgi:hypothetical protein